ncbi:MAG: Histidine kinase [Modestobacter sp.]|nr:Histidine kinase [Modestobacter sp.]
MRAGLIRRMIAASGLLALIVGATFAVLLSMIAQLREAGARAQHSDEVLVVANRLERLVGDLETGERGFLITAEEDLLQPWQAARAEFPEQATTLERMVADNPAQQARAREIAQAGTSYIQDYSVPLVAAARRDLNSARTATVIAEGKRRIDAIRTDFDRFVAAEQDLAGARQLRSEAADHRAVVVAAGGLAGSILLIVVFGGYLSKAIVRPVRRAATMARRLAGGELGARTPERGVGEIGVLERSFNTMARSLEETRGELTASRARIVAAGDQARRRIEHDLHDGTQQQLVALVLDTRSAEAAVPPELPELKAQLARVADGLGGALDDLRELSRGIHPAILSEGGLGAALKALARRSVVPVLLEVDIQQRLPEPVEVAAYYVVSEALTNAAKHARASVARVDARAGDGALQISVSDDGIGGADAGRGSGLIGLTDRVEALSGTISVSSPAGKGTALRVELPLDGR